MIWLYLHLPSRTIGIALHISTYTPKSARHLAKELDLFQSRTVPIKPCGDLFGPLPPYPQPKKEEKKHTHTMNNPKCSPFLTLRGATQFRNPTFPDPLVSSSLFHLLPLGRRRGASGVWVSCNPGSRLRRKWCPGREYKTDCPQPSAHY